MPATARPARSYTQTRVVSATPGATQAAITVDSSPSPGSRTTVGLPEPVQAMWSRWPPTSTSRPGMAAAEVAPSRHSRDVS